MTSVLRALVRIPGRAITAALLGLLWAYRNLVSPLLGPSCRYYPSCSTYAVQALQVHGAAKGTALAVARVCRCHPWAAGGVDHVPPRGRWRPEPDPDPDPDHHDADGEPATLAAVGSAAAPTASRPTASEPAP